MRSLLLSLCLLTATAHAQQLNDPEVPRLRPPLSSPRAAYKRRLRIAGATLFVVSGLALAGGLTSLGLWFNDPDSYAIHCGLGCYNPYTPPQRVSDESFAAAGLIGGFAAAGISGAVLLSLSFGK